MLSPTSSRALGVSQPVVGVPLHTSVSDMRPAGKGPLYLGLNVGAETSMCSEIDWTSSLIIGA